MITEKQFLEALEIVKAYKKQVNDLAALVEYDTNEPWIEIKMPPRLNTAIRYHIRYCIEKGTLPMYEDAGDVPVGELVKTLKYSDMQRWRNVGNKTLIEFADNVKAYGLKIKP